MSRTVVVFAIVVYVASVSLTESAFDSCIECWRLVYRKVRTMSCKKSAIYYIVIVMLNM